MIKIFSRTYDIRNITSFNYQIFLIILNMIISIAILHKPATTFICADPSPEINILTPDTAKKFGGTSLGHEVEVGMYIENFQEFDLKTGNFVTDAIIWFKFDPSLISLDTIGQFSFEKGEIKKISKPETKLVEGGLMLASYSIRLGFTTTLDFRPYPVDDHVIYIKLINKSITPKELVFEGKESGFSISTSVQLAGWRKKGLAVTTGYTEAQLDSYNLATRIFAPAALFSIKFQRTGARYLLVMLLPLFFILYLSFLTLMLNKEEYGQRLGVSIGNVTALISQRFVIENMAPKVGYFMLSDHMFNLFLAEVFIIFFLNIGAKKKDLLAVRGTVLLTCHLVFIAIWYYLMFYWVY